MERSHAIRYTYSDLLALPEESLGRYEIIDGELFVTPGPRWNHQRVAADVTRILHGLVSGAGLGEVLGPMVLRLHEELVLVPDVVFVREDHMHIVDPEGHVQGPPDLVVEILSPGTQRYDWTVKRKRYLESGVAELWIVDIDRRSIDVWRPGAAAGTTVHDRLVWRIGGHTLEVPLEDVFRGVRPARP
jgi:Uma2 family endonuclease